MVIVFESFDFDSIYYNFLMVIINQHPRFFNVGKKISYGKGQVKKGP